VLTPRDVEPARPYPLLTVFHGAGRREEMLVRALAPEAEARQALFLVPRSLHLTWDLIALGIPEDAGMRETQPPDTPPSDRPDLDFLEYATSLVYERYRVDPERQGLLGYSDGATYALALGLSNPDLFRAVMAWAAGFLAVDEQHLPPGAAPPHVFLEYGTHDELFPFERVAVPMRAALEERGVPLVFRVDRGGRHWPSGDFQPEALDWFFSEPWQARS
jgi:phospholipase/carboxylesterase